MSVEPGTDGHLKHIDFELKNSEAIGGSETGPEGHTFALPKGLTGMKE